MERTEINLTGYKITHNPEEDFQIVRLKIYLFKLSLKIEIDLTGKIDLILRHVTGQANLIRCLVSIRCLEKVLYLGKPQERTFR